MRKIVIDAEDFDRPVDLQAIQEATARWNGQTIDLTWNLVIGGNLEILRAPITAAQAALFAARLRAALSKAKPKKKKRKMATKRR
jgi:hypothetical protein